MMPRDEIETRRLKAAGDLLRGVSQAAVSKKYGVSRTTTSRWKNAIVKFGLKALNRRTATGRPPRLNPSQFAEVARIYGQERVTHEQLANLIYEKWGIRYNPDHMGRMLKKVRQTGKA